MSDDTPDSASPDKECKIGMRASLAELKMNPVKTLLVLFAACGLLLASQRPAQAQVSWGIPLPFPFLFYNFNQGYAHPYYGGQRAYYGQGYYCRPGDCTPSRARHTFTARPITGHVLLRTSMAAGYYGPGWGGYGGW